MEEEGGRSGRWFRGRTSTVEVAAFGINFCERALVYYCYVVV